jgi:hypothetical protein
MHSSPDILLSKDWDIIGCVRDSERVILVRYNASWAKNGTRLVSLYETLSTTITMYSPPDLHILSMFLLS